MPLPLTTLLLWPLLLVIVPFLQFVEDVFSRLSSSEQVMTILESILEWLASLGVTI